MLKSIASPALLALLLWTSPGSAQEPTPPASADSLAELDLPVAVAQAVVDFFNDPHRIRRAGPTRVPADSVLRGDLAVLDGPLVVAGRVEGSVVLVNGSLELLPGAHVTGDLLVVGGAVRGEERAVVQGEILSYPERLHFRRQGERIVRVPRGARAATEPLPTAGRWGRSDFLITTGKSYNRVEGLPITFGPRIETAGSNPLRVHALGIYRTESGFTMDTERMGYYVRAEQFLGGRRSLRMGVTAHSMVEPIEEWHLSDLENGLATFLFHRDFRDHYERRGVSLFAGWEPRRSPLALGAEVRWERHGSLSPGSPWTLFDNAEPWRAQPLVAQGQLATVALNATVDSRSYAFDPASGWYLRGRVEHGFDMELVRPAGYGELHDPGDGSSVPLTLEAAAFGAFRTGLLDLRRYNRVDPQSRLNFRLLLAGSLDGRPLPPQRQHALGGEGSLPGYSLLGLDCGARAALYYRTPEEAAAGSGVPFYGGYGCDAVALLQTEFRGKLDFRLRLDSAPWEDGADDEERGWGLGVDMSPDWVVFVDAGRGWAFDDRRDEEIAVDLGVGLLVDRVGVFLAKPLRGGQGLNLFVRLGPRF